MEKATQPLIRRARTAIRRVEYSRPVKVALSRGLLTPERTFFDYGCGRGDDHRRLLEEGFDAAGWDPAHLPSAPRRASDVVNFGYVANVIEDPGERGDALRRAWGLTQRVLVVAARMKFDRSRNENGNERAHGDGCVTSRDTFQRYYTQSELREWVDETLQVQAVPAVPGVMLVFRVEEDRQEYLSAWFRSRRTGPRLRQCDVLFTEHKELIQALCDFFEDHGRIPQEDEYGEASAVREAFGSTPRAFQVIRRVTGPDQWAAAAQRCHEDLMIHIGLERFGGRPRMGALTPTTQRDVRAHFGTYRKACKAADELLFSVGDLSAVGRAMEESEVGKKTQSALYVHVSARDSLPVILRVYEGCARRYYGQIEDANVLKLDRLKPKISYLEYPEFERTAHPVLLGSHVVSLGSYEVRYFDYSKSGNPPILHRKELLVGADHPEREEFAALTAQEEELGLLDEAAQIGRRKGWEDALRGAGVVIRGHTISERSSAEVAVSTAKTIHEAIAQVLRGASGALTLDELIQAIGKDELYAFKVANPRGVVRQALRRRLEGHPSSDRAGVPLFREAAGGRYVLIP